MPGCRRGPSKRVYRLTLSLGHIHCNERSLLREGQKIVGPSIQRHESFVEACPAVLGSQQAVSV